MRNRISRRLMIATVLLALAAPYRWNVLPVPAAAAEVAAPGTVAEGDSQWQAPTPTADTVCGNSLIEEGETCETCPADCAVHPCEPSGAEATYSVKVLAAPATKPAAVAVRLAYRSDRLRLPNSGATAGLRDRVKSIKTTSQIVPNDMDHSLRVVLADANGLGDGGFRVSFDRCKGAEPTTVDDLACWIERCSGSGGAIAGCGCTVDKVE